MTAATSGQPFASRICSGIPPHGTGQAIGLYGGSFNPPHDGHRRVAVMALRRLRLDAVWWLVTPGNPLKDPDGLANLDDRLSAAAAVARHPRITVSGLEARHRIRYTADLANLLACRCPGVRFVWIMGGDNLVQFHQWGHWRRIVGRFPLAVINRPGWIAAPLQARAAQALATRRIDQSDAVRLADAEPPAWTHISGPRTELSSTAIRDG